MKRERLFQILGLVDDDLIEEAVPASSAAAFKRRDASWRILGLAACLVLICGLGLWLRSGGAMTGVSGGADGMAPGAGSGGSGPRPRREPLRGQHLQREIRIASYTGPRTPRHVAGGPWFSYGKRVYANGAPGAGPPRQPGGKGEGKEGNPPPRGKQSYTVTA